MTLSGLLQCKVQNKHFGYTKLFAPRNPCFTSNHAAAVFVFVKFTKQQPSFCVYYDKNLQHAHDVAKSASTLFHIL